MMKHAKQWLGLLGVLAVLGCTVPEMLAQVPGAAGDAVSVPNGVVGQDVGEPSGEVARWKELEAHLSRLESRLEDYRRSQDRALAEMDATLATRLRTLEAGIDAYFKKIKKEEVKAIRQKSQSSLVRVLEEAQTKHDNDAKELRQYVEGWRTKVILCCIFAFFVIIIVVLCFLWFLAWKRKNLEYNARYCLEMVLWGTILVLVSFGAFHLVSRIVDNGTNGCALQNISSPHGSKAVLQAYEQLSSELGNWGALLGVMGVFFGLVLPVGGYLLQLKVGSWEEEKIEKIAQRQFESFKKQMDGQLQQTWEEVASMHHIEHQDYSQSLMRHKACGTQVSLEETWIWVRWICSILSTVQTLSRVRDKRFVQKTLDSLIEDMETVKKRSEDFLPMQQEQFKELLNNRTIQLKGDVNKLREQFKKEMDELTQLLSDCGVSFA